MQSQFSASFFALSDAQGAIYVQDVHGTRQIGVSFEKYKEMEKIASDAVGKAEGYYKQLVDAGLIVPALTTEQQLEILAKQNAELTQQVGNLTRQISTLLGVKNEFHDVSQSRTSEKQPTSGESSTSTDDSGSISADKKRRS